MPQSAGNTRRAVASAGLDPLPRVLLSSYGMPTPMHSSSSLTHTLRGSRGRKPASMFGLLRQVQIALGRMAYVPCSCSMRRLTHGSHDALDQNFRCLVQ